MNIILRTGFKEITHSIAFHPQAIGKKLAVSHVQRVEERYTNDTGILIIDSVVRQTSVTLHPYRVSLKLDNNRHVLRVSCNYVSSAGKKCKHIYALIWYINSDRSATKTSIHQEWGKPSDYQFGQEMYSKPLIVSKEYNKKLYYKTKVIIPFNLQISDMKSNSALLRILQASNITETQTIVKQIIIFILDNVMKRFNDKQIKETILKLINLSKHNTIYYSTTNIMIDVKLDNFYNINVRLTDDQLLDLCVRTKDQSKCKEWFDARCTRISASTKAHKIKCNKKKDKTELAVELLKHKDLKIASLEYGKKNEKRAICDYINKYNKNVQIVGLFINPLQPWLCASVDGIVIDTNNLKILEIKCPSSCSYKPIFDATKNTFNVSYLYLDENNMIKLTASHSYYIQYQIQMYVTELHMCHLYVWSRKDSCLATILRDEIFLQEVVPKIQNFYFQYYLNALYSSYITSNDNL